MGFAWFTLEPPAHEDLERATTPFAGFPLFVLYNDGWGLRIALPPGAGQLSVLEAWGYSVGPATLPPKLHRAEPFACAHEAIDELSGLRFGAALIVPRPGRGGKLVRDYYRARYQRRAIDARPVEEWYESIMRMGYTYFESYMLKLRSGKSEKPLVKLLQGKRPHRKRVLLSPSCLAELLKALSWARYVNPVPQEEVQAGRGCVLLLSAVGGTTGRIPALAIGFRERENNTMLIVGDPGTGKTALLRSLTFQLYRYAWPRNVLIFDFAGEYTFLRELGFRVLRAGVDFFVNPLRLGPQLAAEVVIEVVQAVWGERMTPIQVTDVLLPAFSRARTLFDALRIVADIERSSAREDVRNAAAAVLRRIAFIVSPALAAEGELPEGRAVVDLAPIEGEAAKIAFILTCLQMLYLRPRPCLAVIDDVGKLGRECRILDNVIMHLRKHDVHVWAAAQDPELAPPALREAAHIVVFRTSSRTAQQLAGSDPLKLEKLQFVYRGREYPLYFPKDLPASRAVAQPLPFSAAAAGRGLDPIQLMENYVRFFEKRHIIAGLVTGRPFEPQEKDELNRIIYGENGIGPKMAYALAEIYAMLG